MGGFVLPRVAPQPDGWGPPAGLQPPPEFADLPYAPFSKSDKLGRAADWTQTGYSKFGGCA